jgi:hypothetical protein
MARGFHAKAAGENVTHEFLCSVAMAKLNEMDHGERKILWKEEGQDTKECTELDIKDALALFVAGVDHEGKPIPEFLPHAKIWSQPEYKFKVQLKTQTGLVVDVVGYLDLVIDDGSHTVTDWKFSKRADNSVEVGMQEAIYSLWHTAKFGEPTTMFQKIQLLRRKQGKKKARCVEVLRNDPIKVGAHDRGWYVEKVIEPAVQLKEACIWLANPSNCSWCDYRQLCKYAV